MQLYHIARNQVEIAKVTKEELLHKVGEGAFLPTDLIWTEGMKNWEPLGNVMPMKNPPKQAQAPVAPAQAKLWSPFGCAVFAGVFTFPIASLLIRKNWLSVRKPSRAAACNVWIYLGLTLFVVYAVINVLNLSSLYTVMLFVAWAVAHFIWHRKLWRDFQIYVACNFADGYKKRSFAPSVLQALILVVCLYFGLNAINNAVKAPERKLQVQSIDSYRLPGGQKLEVKADWSPSEKIRVFSLCQTLMTFNQEVSGAEAKNRVCTCVTARVCSSMSEKDYLKQTLGGENPNEPFLETCIAESVSNVLE